MRCRVRKQVGSCGTRFKTSRGFCCWQAQQAGSKKSTTVTVPSMICSGFCSCARLMLTLVQSCGRPCQGTIKLPRQSGHCGSLREAVRGCSPSWPALEQSCRSANCWMTFSHWWTTTRNTLEAISKRSPRKKEGSIWPSPISGNRRPRGKLPSGQDSTPTNAAHNLHA